MSLTSLVCVQSGAAGHMEKVGQWLRSARARNDFRGTNVEIVCGSRTERVHFAVLAAHSAYFRRLIDSHGLPLRVGVVGCKANAVLQVIEWMHDGTLKFLAQELGDFFAVSTALAMHPLHGYLEDVLVQLASRPTMRLFCLNVATDMRYKVSNRSQVAVLNHFVSEHTGLSANDIHSLTLASVVSLVSYQTVSFAKKLDVINTALTWLSEKEHRRYADTVLNALCIERLQPAGLYMLVARLKEVLASSDCTSVRVTTKDGRTVDVRCGKQKPSDGHSHDRCATGQSSDHSGHKRGTWSYESSVGPGKPEEVETICFKPAYVTVKEDSQLGGKLPPVSSSSECSVATARTTDSDFRCGVFRTRPVSNVNTARTRTPSTSSRDGLSSGSQIFADTQQQFAANLSDEDDQPSIISCTTVNRYDFSDDSVADIHKLPVSFTPARTRGRSPAGHGTSNRFRKVDSEGSVEVHPLLPSCFSPNAGVIKRPYRLKAGRYDRCPESIEEINLHEMSFCDVAEKSHGWRERCTESVAEIAELPDLFDHNGKKYHPKEHCEESVAEIAQLPDAFNKASRSPCPESIAEIEELPEMFLQPKKSHGWRERCPESVAEIAELPELFDHSGKSHRKAHCSAKKYHPKEHCEESVAEIEQLPDAFNKADRSHCPESIAEIKELPEMFHHHHSRRSSRVKGSHCDESVAEISQLPDFF